MKTKQDLVKILEYFQEAYLESDVQNIHMFLTDVKEIDTILKCPARVERDWLVVARNEKAEEVASRKKRIAEREERERTDEAAELEKAALTALTKEQLEERAGELYAEYESDWNLAVVKQLAQTYEQLAGLQTPGKTYLNKDWAMCTSFYSQLYQESEGDVALRDKIDEIEDRATEAYEKDVEAAAAASPSNEELQTELKEIESKRLDRGYCIIFNTASDTGGDCFLSNKGVLHHNVEGAGLFFWETKEEATEFLIKWSK